MERLQKTLARAGIASRRAAERLIREGRVTVNGHTVTRMGTQVDPHGDVVKVDGKKIPHAPRMHTYLALHKPRGFVTTLSDPEGRPTIVDLLPDVRVRVYPVGRLDYHTEGLLLLTDDGDLARDLMHPRSRVPRTYLAKVRGEPSSEALARLSRGALALDGKKTLPATCRIVRSGDHAWVEITVVEGRKHQVRRMLEAVGHPVQRLRRVSYGGVALGRLPAGRVRALLPLEVDRLRRAVLRGGAAGARGDRRARA
jgi:23S rRNA pseudouridine2605 synthase/16S rRNA pseudouridine516 synthase